MPLEPIDNLIEAVNDQFLVLDFTEVTSAKVDNADGTQTATWAGLSPKNAGRIGISITCERDKVPPYVGAGQAVYDLLLAHIATNWTN